MYMSEDEKLDIDGLPEQFQNMTDESSDIERIYDTMIGIKQPAPVEDIAELSLCSEDVARDGLRVLEDIGVIREESDGDEERFVRDEKYFRWARAREIADEEDVDGIDEIQSRVNGELRALEQMYGSTSPRNMTPARSQNEELQKRIEQDVIKWNLLLQTKDDLKLARTLLKTDPE